MRTTIVGQTAEQIAEAIIAAARIAGMAVRCARLRCPEAEISIKQRIVRGCVRDVMAVKDSEHENGHARLGDLLYDLSRDPYGLQGERDGENRIVVPL